MSGCGGLNLSVSHTLSGVGSKGVKDWAARDVGKVFAMLRFGVQMLRMWQQCLCLC